MDRILKVVFALVLLAAGAVSCRREAPAPASGSATNQTFIVKGVVKEVARKFVTIQHENIPDYMPAMTMPFDLKNPVDAKGIKPGDPVSFRLNVRGDDSWIDQISKLNVSPVEMPSRQSVQAPRDLDPINMGEAMPNFTFTNELGQAVHLDDFRGKAVALTFIFTRCPLPNFCPRMSSNFSEAAKKLSAKSDAPKNWQLLSISFDPDFDTPAVLKAYAGRYNYDAAHWSFLTGSKFEIGALAAKLGMIYVEEAGTFNHNLRTAIIDPRGRVQKILLGNDWTSDQLVAELIQAAAVP